MIFDKATISARSFDLSALFEEYIVKFLNKDEIINVEESPTEKLIN